MTEKSSWLATTLSHMKRQILIVKVREAFRAFGLIITIHKYIFHMKNHLKQPKQTFVQERFLHREQQSFVCCRW